MYKDEIMNIIKGFDEYYKQHNMNDKQKRIIEQVRAIEQAQGIEQTEQKKVFNNYMNIKIQIGEEREKERLLKQYTEQYFSDKQLEETLKTQLEPTMQKIFNSIVIKA